MRKSQKAYTEEELYDMEEKLLEKEEQDTGYPLFNEWIRLYGHFFEFYNTNNGYSHEIENVRIKLVNDLLDYGLYLKSSVKKDSQLAGSQLKKVLYYDRNNPLALYRLGFLYYRDHTYHKAIHYLNASLENSQDQNRKQWRLNERQTELASLYLLSSTLHLKELHGSTALQSGVEGYELAPAIEQVISNKEYSAFTKDEQWFCTYESCQAQFEEASESNELVLFFDYQFTYINYRDRYAEMHIEYARLLKTFMQESRYDRPLGAKDIHDMFPVNVRNNTYIQKIRRVRKFLKDHLGIEEVIIKGEADGSHTRYFFNHDFNFLILARTDF